MLKVSLLIWWVKSSEILDLDKYLRQALTKMFKQKNSRPIIVQF
jgi:hypothetical protein